MKKNKIPLLAIGPMSLEIIEAIYHYSHDYRTPLMLIASKNQIDYASGYVCRTSEFAKFSKKYHDWYPKSDVWICRDHCGPSFNGIYDLKDTYRTINEDLDNDFDLIHIDFCHIKTDETNKLTESKKAIEYIVNKDRNMKIEIGIVNNTGKDFQNIHDVENNMKFFTSFCKPTFFTCQTGSLIKETYQAGCFNTEYVKNIYKLAVKYRLHIKEHNTDYLSSSEIKKRKPYITALNVAPQFGVLQTMFTLTKAMSYGIDIEHFLTISYQSKKWKKWLQEDSKHDAYRYSIIAGHYNFKSKEYRQMVNKIEKYEDFSSGLKKEIFNLIHLYIQNLS